jgi:hypothetical protein
MFRSLRPSPSMAVALIALFISLSGVSYGVATGFIDSRELKNNTVRSPDLKNNDIRTQDVRNNEVRGRDIRNSSILSRDIGFNTLTGNDINESKLATVPAAASPLAFARVDAAGGVVEGDSRDVADANVRREGVTSNVYCFRGLSFAFKTAQVTIDYTGTNKIAMVDKANSQGKCSGTGVQLAVVTTNADAAAPPPQSSGFYIWFYN